jgi:hypothetical protein
MNIEPKRNTKMEHQLKIINSSAYVARKGYIHAMLDFVTPSVLLCTRETLLVAPTLRDLTAAVGGLPRCLGDLDYKVAQNMDDESKRTVAFKIGKSDLITSTVTDDVAKFVTRVPELLHKITPLLELGDAICRAPKPRERFTNFSVKFYTCTPRATGESMERWLVAQKRRAIKFRRSSSCEVIRTFTTKRDPYGLCSGQMEDGMEWLIREPNNDLLWFGELPRDYAWVLRDVIRAQKRATKLVPKGEVRLGLKLLHEESRCIVIPFRR